MSRELNKNQRYHKRKPWVRYICWARRRCRDVRSKWYPYYGAKGIICDLTAAQAEVIWYRDGGGELRRPSLDRINSDGNYTADNVRFIEFDINSRLALDPTFRFLYNEDSADLPYSAHAEGVRLPQEARG